MRNSAEPLKTLDDCSSSANPVRPNSADPNSQAVAGSGTAEVTEKYSVPIIPFWVDVSSMSKLPVASSPVQDMES